MLGRVIRLYSVSPDQAAGYATYSHTVFWCLKAPGGVGVEFAL